MSVPVLDLEHITYLTRLGYSHCFSAYYCTKPFLVLSGVVGIATSYILPKDSIYGLVDFGSGFEARTSFVHAYFVDGNYQFEVGNSSRPVRGSYLRFIVPAKSVDEAMSLEVRVENCASLVSAMHGEFVAFEKHFSCAVDLQSGDNSSKCEGFSVRQTIKQEDLNQKLAIIFDEERNCDFVDKPNVISLIRRAHHERENSLKFLFMWIALECALGSGKERERFALKEMGSKSLNNTIIRLAKKRSLIVHDGTIVDLDQKEYLRLKCIILMGLTSNPLLQKRLLVYLEIELA